MRTLVTKIVLAGMVAVALGVTAHAQSATFGHQVGVDIGKDVSVGHQSGGTVGVKNGQITAGGGVADGVKIGDSKATSGFAGQVQIPTLGRQIIPGLPGLPFGR